MDQQWAAYNASDNAQRLQRYQPHPLATATTPQQQARDNSFEAYGSPSISSRAASMTISPQSASQSRSIMYNGDGDGDLPMEDVDPYKQRQPSRPNNPNRHSSQFLEESTAARRYSPMNTSPSSPSSLYSPQQATYGSLNTIGMQQSSSRRQSPTRTNPYSSGYYSPGTLCISLPPSRPLTYASITLIQFSTITVFEHFRKRSRASISTVQQSRGS